MTSDLNERRWEWSDGLDAEVAAPAHHHVLLENERVRVLEMVELKDRAAGNRG